MRRGSGPHASTQSLLSPTIQVGLREDENSRRSDYQGEPNAARDEGPSYSELESRFEVLEASSLGQSRGWCSF